MYTNTDSNVAIPTQGRQVRQAGRQRQVWGTCEYDRQVVCGRRGGVSPTHTAGSAQWGHHRTGTPALHHSIITICINIYYYLLY